MSKVEITKSKPTEIMTRVDAHGRLYKDLQTGKIILEVYVDGDFEILKDKDWINWANKKLEEEDK